MANQFDTLFSVNFSHDYYNGDGYAAFSIAPTPATSAFLLRLGFIFKAGAHGFRIVFDTQFQGSERERKDALKQQAELVFNLTSNDPDFLTYTGDLSDGGNDISKSIFCFTNHIEGAGFRSRLHEKEHVSGKEIIPLSAYPEKFFSKPFAQIRITLHENLEPSFTVRFAAKSTHWRYLLVSDYLKELVSPAVMDKETGELFVGPERIALPGSGEAIAFYSVKPVMLTAKPNKSFQLVENYESGTGKYRVVKGVLPNPITGAISNIPSGSGVGTQLNFSEILL